MLEAQLATMARGGEPGLRSLRFILSRPTIEIAAFSDRHAQSAFDAFDRYGRGRHPAKLNLGDCVWPMPWRNSRTRSSLQRAAISR